MLNWDYRHIARLRDASVAESTCIQWNAHKCEPNSTLQRTKLYQWSFRGCSSESQFKSFDTYRQRNAEFSWIRAMSAPNTPLRDTEHSSKISQASSMKLGRKSLWVSLTKCAKFDVNRLRLVKVRYGQMNRTRCKLKIGTFPMLYNTISLDVI